MAPVPPAAAERQARHHPLHAERPMRRAVAWLGGVALIVLAARSVVYALSPSPLAAALGRHAGGPALPAIAAVSLGLAVALAVAIVSLAGIAVAERRELETRRLAATPRLRLGLLCRRVISLTVASCLTFALLESYIHWRGGLAFRPWAGFIPAPLRAPPPR